MSDSKSDKNPPTILQQLTHSTIRLETELSNGDTSTGTGFFYIYDLGNNNSVPVIVTNKHVIDDSVLGKLIFSKSGVQNVRTLEKASLTIENFSSGWILHPDAQVDLCVLPLKPYSEELLKKGLTPYVTYLDSKSIPTETQWSEFTLIEDVIMIGYPNGIWDEVSNLPIVRKGITATPLSIDYNGKKEFLIDVSVFPGSSGSPIFLFNQGSYVTPKGISIGTRVFLVGVTYAVYQYAVSGDIIMKEISNIEQTCSSIIYP